MALRHIRRCRVPLDGRWFRTEGRLQSSCGRPHAMMTKCRLHRAGRAQFGSYGAHEARRRTKPEDLLPSDRQSRQRVPAEVTLLPFPPGSKGSTLDG